MLKLTVLAAVFAALIAAAAAYNDDEQSCQSKVQEMQMSPCMQWISPTTTSVLRSAVGPISAEEQCCSEMRKVREECHCDMMKKMMSEMRKISAFTRMKKILFMFRTCQVQFPQGCTFPLLN